MMKFWSVGKDSWELCFPCSGKVFRKEAVYSRTNKPSAYSEDKVYVPVNDAFVAQGKGAVWKRASFRTPPAHLTLRSSGFFL